MEKTTSSGLDQEAWIGVNRGALTCSKQQSRVPDVAQRPVSGRARSHQSIDDVTRTARPDFHPTRASATAATNCFRGLPGRPRRGGAGAWRGGVGLAKSNLESRPSDHAVRTPAWLCHLTAITEVVSAWQAVRHSSQEASMSGWLAVAEFLTTYLVVSLAYVYFFPYRWMREAEAQL